MPGPAGRALPARLPGLPAEDARPSPRDAAWHPEPTEVGTDGRLKPPTPPNCWRSSARSGPTSPGSGWTRRVDPDRLVKTHCCFCGQQCGIQLKVKDNQVIGFEPWVDFPFNKGMLCPKGVRRYLQGSHHDRLTSRLRPRPVAARGVPGGRLRRGDPPRGVRDPAHPVDVRQRRLRRARRGEHDDREVLPARQVRPGLPEDAVHRLQRPALHGRRPRPATRRRSASTGPATRCRDIPLAEVIWIGGANVAECARSPPATSGRPARTGRGSSTSIRASRPLARTCDLVLPVKPGRDAALFAGVLHLMIENDWLDHDFIRNHTVGFEKAAEAVQEWTPRKTAEVTGIAEKAIRQAAEWWGTAKTSFLMHARGMEQHTHGVNNCLASINIVLACGRIGRPGCGYSTITGQGNGQGGREHGQKADQLPGGRDIENPEHRRYVAGVWGVPEEELPHAGVDCYEMFRKVESGEIRGLLVLVVQPGRLAAGQHVRQADAGEAGVLRLHRLLPERDGPVRRRGPARLAARGGRGDRLLDRGAGDQDQPGGDAARRREAGLARSSRTSPRPSAASGGSRSPARGRSSRSCGGRQPGRRRRLLGHHLREDRGGRWASSGRARTRTADGNPIDHPGTPRLFEPGSWNPVAKGAGPFYFPDGKARFHAIHVRAADRGRGRRLPGHPDHRPGGEHVPVRATRRGGSARWWTSTRSRSWSCTRSWPAKHGDRRRRLGDGREPPRAA